MADDDRRDDLDDDDLGDDAPATRGEIKILLSRLDALEQAREQRREASTPAERDRADDRIEDKEDAVERAARQAGLSGEQLRKAIASTRDELRFDTFKKDLDRYFREQDADADDEPKPKPRKRSAAKREPAGDAGANGAGEPPGDTGPTKLHWSERSLSDVLR